MTAPSAVMDAPRRAALADFLARSAAANSVSIRVARLLAILDWEFAGWSDPLEDIGWFCARCWRFGQRRLEAGGIGAREDFYRGYEQESGRTIDRGEVVYWEVAAHLNWAMISNQQAERYLSGGERSLLLALTAQITPQLELEILDMTREG